MRIYGGEGGSREWRYELILWTKVDFPAPAMPIAMIVIGFFFVVLSAGRDVVADDEDGSMVVVTIKRRPTKKDNLK